MDLGYIIVMTSVFEFKSSGFHFSPTDRGELRSEMEMEWHGKAAASFIVSLSRN